MFVMCRNKTTWNWELRTENLSRTKVMESMVMGISNYEVRNTCTEIMSKNKKLGIWN